MNPSNAPVDTLEEPHEPVVATRRIAPALGLLLAGPAVWMTHFWVVYLVAESSCAAHRSPDISFTGERGLTVIVLVATVVALVLCAAAARVNHARSTASVGSSPSPERELGRIGQWLAIGSAVSVVAVGLPIVLLTPC